MIPSARRLVTHSLRLTATPKVSLTSIRNGGHAAFYRRAPGPAPKWVQNTAEVVSAVAWWWILWHLWTEPGHITGEFPYPDPSKWTNEELGIE